MSIIKNEMVGIKLHQRIGIADVIESKSLLSMLKAAGNEKLPMAHEKILFSTIAPDMKMLPALGRFELSSSEGQNNMKEKIELQRQSEH